MTGFRSQQLKSMILNAFSAALIIFAGASYTWSATSVDSAAMAKVCKEAINPQSSTNSAAGACSGGTCTTGTCTLQEGRTTLSDGTVVIYFYCDCI